MTNHELPTSEWEHSHAVEEGDVYNVDEFGVDMEVVEVHNDGSVTANLCPEGVDEDERIEQEYSEEEVTTALADGLWERESDGLSHELATF